MSEVKTQDLTDITAAILAGGLGTRLRLVVADRPKALAKISDRPFLTYLLDQVITAGIQHVVLCSGYMGGQLKDTLGNSYGPLQLTYSQESEPLGTAGALRLALPLLQSDPVLVMNGDSYCQADLPQFFAWHQTVNADASLYLIKVSDSKRYGRVHVNENGHILRFEEKGQKADPGWVNAGVYLLSKNFVADIPTGRVVSIEKEIFPRWIGQAFYGYCGSGHFLDIGTPESYAQAEVFLGQIEEFRG